MMHYGIMLWTIIRKELHRVLRLWMQTLFPPVINMTLYFFVFGQMVGRHIGQIDGMSYAQFITPGLIMLGMVTNAYMNASSSTFLDKFQGCLQEVLVAPIPEWMVMLGIVIGGMLRGMIVGGLIAIIGWLAVKAVVTHWLVWIMTAMLTSAMFAALGALNGLYANHFDGINFIPAFILTPLTFIGGVFYPISRLPEFWQTVSHYNPLVHMIHAMRSAYTDGYVNIPLTVEMMVLMSVCMMCCIVKIQRRAGVSLK